MTRPTAATAAAELRTTVFMAFLLHLQRRRRFQPGAGRRTFSLGRMAPSKQKRQRRGAHCPRSLPLPTGVARHPQAGPPIHRRPWPVGDAILRRCPPLLRHLQINGLGTLATLVRLGLERHAHALIKRADARPLDGRDVDEHVLSALIWCDETKPL